MAEEIEALKGERLFPVVVALRQWGERYLFARSEQHSTLIDKSTGQPVPLMALQAGDGNVLTPDAAMVKKLQ
ncbi:hypothetical protein NDQ72_14495 [Halomonas sp. KG2]|uniref:hypothetical protein n=1 Tax=Halomonadaceae TaxID=28256 RepID=UPI002649F07D|nr:hypothetical protein [Halomonas sp. KG2]WKD27256.1 hypothetical protein NDQ72_14495 [Halomonas sp. KG2]